MDKTQTIFKDYKTDSIIKRVNGFINLNPGILVEYDGVLKRTYYSVYNADDNELIIYCEDN